MPIIVEILLVIALGLSLGSFITLASWRLPREEEIVFRPSHCPHCQAKLRVRELVPVFSWLLARGQCLHCKATIGLRYPVIEMVSAMLCLFLYDRYGLTPEFAMMTLFTTALMIMVVTDLEHYIIPDQVQIALALLAVARIWLIGGMEWIDALAGALFGGGLGLALLYGYKALRGREGLGMGDVKFFAVAGLWLSFAGLLQLFILAGLLGVVLALIWRALGRGKLFPFGPALAISLWILVIYPFTYLDLYNFIM